MISPHVFARKLRTFGTTIARCSNWPSVALARQGFGNPLTEIRFRDGLRLAPLRPLATTWGEIFEPAIADLYNIRQQPPLDVIVDVGANMGSFTCLAARSHPQAKVHSFEPSADHAGQIERNVQLNGLTNVQVHRFAVTGDGREVRYKISGDGGSSGIFMPGEREIVMPSVSLAKVDFTGAQRAFFKVDCEGAEGEIVQWICQHRATLPPHLRVAAEWHWWCPVKMEDAIELLRQHGFKVEAPILFDEQYVFASSGAI